MMRMQATILVVLAVVSAGCTGGDASVPAADPDPTIGSGFDESGGAIEGIVTDAELQPVQGAIITIKDVAETQTDEMGRFALVNLPPGPNLVYVQALGFNSLARTIEVVPGETAEITFTLEALRTEGPRHETQILNGHICGQVFAGGYIVNLGNLPCGGQGSIFVPFEVYGNLEALVAEMSWLKNSGLTANQLDLRIWQGGARSGVFSCEHCYGGAKGKSPIRLEIAGPFAGLKDVAPDAKARFDNAIYVPADSSNPTGVNIVLDQRTTIYDTMFYGGPAPAGFSAMPDQ